MNPFVFTCCIAASIFVNLGAGQQPKIEATLESEQVSNVLTGRRSTEKLGHIRALYPAALSPNNTQCVCGQKSPDIDKISWEVDVHFNSSDFNVRISCRGTVITHNLVLTSVKCLRRAGSQMDTYGDWQLSLNGTTVTINAVKDTFFMQILKVKNISNNNGGVGESYGVQRSAQDIAIIVVDGDLFQTIEREDKSGKKFQTDFRTPVCIPKNEGNSENLMKDVVHRFGYYFGITGGFPDHKLILPSLIKKLVILDGDYCDKEGNFGEFSDNGALCTRSLLFSPPTIEGGPLLTTNVSGYLIESDSYMSSDTPLTEFLVGICSVTEKRPRGKRTSYTYFANVIQNIDFIEKVANEHGSMWCETPEFVDTKKATTDELKLEEWPWEIEAIEERSETLDCACGLLYKNESITPQAALLEDEIPPWVAKIYFSYFSNEPKDFSCFGTIINDRVLVTDPACVVYQEIKNRKVAWENVLKDHEIYIGSSKLFNISDAKLVTAKNIIVHPGFITYWKDTSSKFELALIILDEPLVFATGTSKLPTHPNDIRPICLPKHNEKINIKFGTNLTVWERGPSNETQNLMKKLQVTAPHIRDCAHSFAQLNWETVFCRELFQNYDDTMPAAPSAVRKSNGKYYLVGIDLEERMYFSGDDNSEQYKVSSVDVQEFLQFIEYYSNVNNAKWCKE